MHVGVQVSPGKRADGQSPTAPLVGAAEESQMLLVKMRTFPTMHPSLGSVKNQTATGCPAIVFNQMSSDMWKSTTKAEIWEKNPTLPKRKEGKATPSALFGTADLYVPPVETYVAPPNAPPTIYRDQRVYKHMGTLSRLGTW